ncbi:MAG: helix-turn-helix domain-containing protein [Firmicutes bacterium]|nr:helix-turn-helix domain-containing protein [Bacillota bacterium]
MNIGETIKDLREEKDISMRQLAKNLEVDIKTVWTWENGVKDPSAINIVKLADYFGVTTDYIFGREK